MTTRIEFEPGNPFTPASVYAPFEFKEQIKLFPGRRWVPDRTCWTIRRGDVDRLVAILVGEGETVYVNGMRSIGKPPPQPPPRRQAVGTWAAVLFEAVGPERADATYRAMSRVLHPDAGGDLVLMQQLNAARPLS